MRRYYLLFILNLLLLSLPLPLEAASTIQRDDLAPHFGSFQGSFILLDEKNDRYFVYNTLQSNKRLSPASTFKIIHSLIALETGVVESENTIISWDGRQDTVKPWNQDHSLASAVKHSVVSCIPATHNYDV